MVFGKGDAMSDDDFELDDDAELQDGEDDSTGALIDSAALCSRNKIRAQLQSEIEAFLAKGGQIQQLDSGLSNSPLKKPSSNYGSNSI